MNIYDKGLQTNITPEGKNEKEEEEKEEERK